MICPRRQVEPDAAELIRLWQFWKARVLIYAGGVLDQPARYIEAMEFLDYLQADAQSERMRD